MVVGEGVDDGQNILVLRVGDGAEDVDKEEVEGTRGELGDCRTFGMMGHFAEGAAGAERECSSSRWKVETLNKSAGTENILGVKMAETKMDTKELLLVSSGLEGDLFDDGGGRRGSGRGGSREVGRVDGWHDDDGRGRSSGVG